jgi:membrane associated rhomboid family serine protease
MVIWERIKYEYSKGNSAIRQIIIINLGVFILSVLLAVAGKLMVFESSEILQYFYLPSDLSTLVFRPWTLLTNIFLHSGFRHIFWNLLMLYFIGRILEDYLSREKIWQIFLYGGLIGGLFFVISYNVFPAFEAEKSISRLLGASGGVTATLVAAGVFLPRYQVRPYGLFTIELRWVALILVLLDLVAFPNSSNAGGILAHIGGAIFGMLYIFELQGKIEFPKFKFAKPNSPKMKTTKTTSFDSSSKSPKQKADIRPNQEEIDAILDKISQSGYDSLSSREKEVLFKASE